MPKIQAIITHYAGFRFRSRAEARYAVLLDAMGEPYDFEREGFDLGGVWYLPDFLLPRQNCWLELKAESPTREELSKAHWLAQHTGCLVYVFSGQLGTPEHLGIMCDGEVGEDWPYHWCDCPNCGIAGLQWEGRADRLPCQKNTCIGIMPPGRWHGHATPRLLRAIRRATEMDFLPVHTPRIEVLELTGEDQDFIIAAWREHEWRRRIYPAGEAWIQVDGPDLRLERIIA